MFPEFDLVGCCRRGPQSCARLARCWDGRPVGVALLSPTGVAPSPCEVFPGGVGDTGLAVAALSSDLWGILCPDSESEDDPEVLVELELTLPSDSRCGDGCLLCYD